MTGYLLKLVNPTLADIWMPAREWDRGIDATSALWTNIVGVANIPDSYTVKEADFGTYTGAFYNSPPSSWYVGDINGGFMISDGVVINLPGYMHFSILKLPTAGGGSGYYYIDYAPTPDGPWTEEGGQHQISHSIGTWAEYSTPVPAFYYDGVPTDPYVRIRFRSNTTGNVAANGLLTPGQVKANYWVDDFRFTEYPGDDPLPVELSSFTAMLSVDNFVNLIWVTQSETNVQGYYILRGDAETLATASVISPLISATNTSQQQTYLFKDTDIPGNGTYFYWLQDSEMDGTSNYFGPVQVDYFVNGGGNPEIPLFTSLGNIYPNPFNPVAYIPYSVADQAEVGIKVFNVRGQVVRDFQLGNKLPGNHTLIWDGKDAIGRECPTGVYYLRLTAGKVVQIQKAVLVK